MSEPIDLSLPLGKFLLRLKTKAQALRFAGCNAKAVYLEGLIASIEEEAFKAETKAG